MKQCVTCLFLTVSNFTYLQLNEPRRLKKKVNQGPVVLCSFVDRSSLPEDVGEMPRSITAAHSDGANAVSAIHHCVFGQNKVVLCRSPRRVDREVVENELDYAIGTVGIVRPNSRHSGKTKPTLKTHTMTDNG